MRDSYFLSKSVKLSNDHCYLLGFDLHVNDVLHPERGNHSQNGHGCTCVARRTSDVLVQEDVRYGVVYVPGMSICFIEALSLF